MITYYPTRTDSFLATTDIRPRDTDWFGHTEKQKAADRRKLLDAVNRNRKDDPDFIKNLDI